MNEECGGFDPVIRHGGYEVSAGNGSSFFSGDCWLVVGCDDYWRPVHSYGTAFGFDGSYDVLSSAVEQFDLSESKVLIFNLDDAYLFSKNGGNE